MNKNEIRNEVEFQTREWFLKTRALLLHKLSLRTPVKAIIEDAITEGWKQGYMDAQEDAETYGKHLKDEQKKGNEKNLYNVVVLASHGTGGSSEIHFTVRSKKSGDIVCDAIHSYLVEVSDSAWSFKVDVDQIHGEKLSEVLKRINIFRIDSRI